MLPLLLAAGRLRALRQRGGRLKHSLLLAIPRRTLLLFLIGGLPPKIARQEAIRTSSLENL